MDEQKILESLAGAAAKTIIDRLQAQGMTEDQIGAWLFNNPETVMDMAMKLIEYTTTPEFHRNVIEQIASRQ